MAGDEIRNCRILLAVKYIISISSFEIKLFLFHLLQYSENHFRVYIKEHLTKERARAIYLMKKAGYEVTTDECRINYKKNSEAGVINSLSDLQSKLNWETADILKVFSKLQLKNTDVFTDDEVNVGLKILFVNVRG